MEFDVDPLVAVIVAGEVGFWMLLGAGLVARYLLRRRTAGAVLLACTPLVDLVVLGATVLDLRGGGSASWSHGLAAAYLGVSVAFGPSMCAGPISGSRTASRMARRRGARRDPAARGCGTSGASGPSTCWRGRSPAACCSGWSR